MEVVVKSIAPRQIRACDLDVGKTYLGVTGGAKDEVFLCQPGQSLVNFNRPQIKYDASDYDLSTFIECKVTVTVEGAR
ncbi:hypothetical protein PMW_166 [Pseudomonas phage phiPMW]|uniref:Uncharacterized protein n=1 Tax=Pseudomonas phage phiPMW TaxID=1815582 RepID=A0A1S5R1K9_9CAUD|nr:hypothetical protein FDG97_gp184 [Pseudomonas phage phiPMW]ANA49291.1 hypothetical protein PMW_166 [Pseudomonas phage phiPMW]